MQDKEFPYRHILNEEHRKSKNHTYISPLTRAAQFSPFSALVGYEEMVDETARITERRIEPSEYDVDELNRKIIFLKDHLGERAEIKIRHFVPDALKEGGSYADDVGVVEKIREYEMEIVLDGNRTISIKNIVDIDSYLFNGIF